MSKTVSIGLCVLVVAVLGGAAGWMYVHRSDDEQIACTMEAKQCPDGSYVGRTGPNCEFAPCLGAGQAEPPAEDVVIRTYRDDVQGIQYEYPDHLITEFIDTQDWPPVVTVSPSPFVCREGGRAEAAGGATKQADIEDKTYCITIESEGAAGSVFSIYTYTTVHNEKTVSVNFTLRYAQCGNYDPNLKSRCEEERQLFSPDALARAITESIAPFSDAGEVVMPQRVTLRGVYTCLPHKDTSRETKECMTGIKIDSGKYYALDFMLFEPGSEEVAKLHSGDRVEAEGPLTPIEMLSSDRWQAYDVEGILSVTGIKTL